MQETDAIQYGQNFLKCFEIFWKNVLSYSFVKDRFSEHKKFQVKFPDIRKFPENLSLWGKKCISADQFSESEW